MSKTLGTLFLMVAKLCSLGLQLLSIRLIVGWLGFDRYGLVLMIQVWAAYTVVLDLGFWIGIQKMIPEAKAAHDQEKLDFLIRLQLIIIWLNGVASLLLFLAAGFLYSFANAHSSIPVPSPRLVVLGGLLNLGVTYCGTCLLILNALERFKATAAISLLQTFLTVIGAILGAKIFKSPEAVIGGMAIGTWLCAAAARVISAPRRFSTPWRWRPELFKEISLIAKRGYIHRVATQLGRTADKAVISLINPAQLTVYGNACKVPEVLEDVTVMMVQTTVPQMTRAHKKPAEFAGLINRNGLIAISAACCFILVPAAFGRSLLHLWLNWDLQVAGLVLFAMGIYRVFDTFLTSMAGAFYACGHPQQLIPFSLFNAVCTIGGTLPAYHYGGLAGVACLNVGIGLSQGVLIFYQTKRLVGPEFRIGPMMLRASLVVALSLALAGCLHVFLDDRLLVGRAWISLPLIPLCVLALAAILLGARLCPIPEPARKIVRRVYRRDAVAQAS